MVVVRRDGRSDPARTADSTGQEGKALYDQTVTERCIGFIGRDTVGGRRSPFRRVAIGWAYDDQTVAGRAWRE